MTKPNSCEIVVILDRSGSMESIRPAVVDGFNKFIQEQKQIPGECAVSLFQFDDIYEEVFIRKPLSAVPSLELLPRGWTALLDAVGKTVTSMGQCYAAMPEENRPSRVLCLIITDGNENASTEYKKPRIAEMIKHQREKYSWEFVFLGSDESALQVASELRIPHVARFYASDRGVHALFATNSSAVSNYRSGGAYSIPAVIVEDKNQDGKN